MVLYSITKLSSGRYLCRCYGHDDYETWESETIEQAITLMKVSAYNMNGERINEKRIHFYTDNSCGPCESEP